MTRSKSLLPLVTGFERFLYASVGQNDDGLPLSVLSLIARQDVDPWEEAARLSQLPERTAVTRLVALLGSPAPAPADVAEQARLAARLIALLPPRCVAPRSVRNALAEVVPRRYSAMVYYSIASVVIYVAVTMLSG